MWLPFPILSVALPALPALPPDLQPATSDYLFSFGVFALVAILPHFIAAKMLAGEKTNILRVAVAVLSQILLGVLLWLVFAGVFFFCGTSQAMTPWLSGAVTIVLLGLLMAGIYGFGIAKGVVYNFLTAVAMICIFKALVASVDILPLKKVTASLALKMAVKVGETGRQKIEESVSARKQQGTTETKTPAFATEALAQQAAVKKYPALGVAGSPFNKRFREIFARMKIEQPAKLRTTDWPMEIADQVSAEPGMK